MMLRRFLFLALVVILAVPAIRTTAQGDPFGKLTNTYKVNDAGFSFNYFEGWVYSKQGVYLAQNETDLTALTDNDDKTQPKGYTISLTAFALKDLNLTETASLEQVVDSVATISKMTKLTDSPIELPLITRRSLTIGLVDNVSKRQGLITVWRQANYIMLFIFGGPTMDKVAAQAWGAVLDSAVPNNALELTKDQLASDTGLKLNAPQGFNVPSMFPMAAFELAADQDKPQVPKGIIVSIKDEKFSALTGIKTANDYLKYAKDTINFVSPTTFELMGEYILLDSPALMYKTLDENKVYGYQVIFVRDAGKPTAVGVQIIAKSLDAEKLEKFYPTYLAMLMTLK